MDDYFEQFCIVAGFELETLSRDKYFENNSKMSSAGIILCECTEVYNVLNQVCLAVCLSMCWLAQVQKRSV